MISREEYQRLVDELWEALKEESGANSDDAYAKAQATAGRGRWSRTSSLARRPRIPRC
jgi:hypothetical protein